MSAREVFKEFEYLLDKSQRSFNRLRDLPPYGNSRWEHYFHKAFHIYSKLWKFQQDNREVLTARGMERWEIGDIASKIGQLYYNYYLRTAETRFLQESYVFYEAIRSRSYFAASATDPNLSIKQLRYFARFIIICLLLNRKEEVWQLLQEFQALISSYIMKYTPSDAQEWRSVIQEITHFMHADVAMPPPRSPGAALPFRASARAAATHPEVRIAPHRMMLNDAVLVSYYPRQVKIAELPLDSFRMLQALEWEEGHSANSGSGGAVPGMVSSSSSDGRPPGIKGGSKASSDGAVENGAPPGGVRGAYENPSKHLVYRPTALQLLSILTTATEVLPRDGLLLLFISAASSRSDLVTRAASSFPSTSCLTAEITPAEPDPPTPDNMSDVSGPSTGALTAVGGGGSGSGPATDGVHLGSSKAADPSDAFLVPEDLLHLTRRSLFLIVDSDGAAAFARLQGQEVGRTAFCLMSPSARPYELGEASKSGSLMTLFLTLPLSGFCLLAGSADPSVQQLTDLHAALGGVLGEWGAAVARAFASGGAFAKSPWQVPFRDALLRRLMLRFALFRAAVALHVAHGTSLAHYPKCFPELPGCLAPESPEMAAGVAKLAAALGRSDVFADHAPSVGSGSPMSAATTTN